jgi:hypothetical protein
MATPMTADQMVAALADEGVDYREYKDWRHHNREGHGDWGPVYGIMIHHTAITGPGTLDVIYDGREDLPGPLAHAFAGKGGGIFLTGNGRANHAGKGDDDVLNAVIAESALPTPNENNTDGNTHFYGIEIENLGDGDDPYPPLQYAEAVLWATAICRFHGWTSKSVIGHKEWTNTKIDPSFDMDTFRDDVHAQLHATDTDIPKCSP